MMLARAIYVIAITLLFSCLLSHLRLFPYNTTAVFLYSIIIILTIKLLFSVETGLFNLMLWHLYLKNKVKVDTINKLGKYKMPCVMSYFIYDIKSYLEYIIFGKNYLRKKRENIFPINNEPEICIEHLFEDTDYFEVQKEKFSHETIESANRILGQLEGAYFAAQEPRRSALINVWDEALYEFYNKNQGKENEFSAKMKYSKRR